MWKTAFKKFEIIWDAETDHIISSFLKAVFHKFYLVHCLEYLVANAISSINVVNAVLMLFQHRLNLNKPNHLQYFYVVFYSAYDPGITCSKSLIITLEKRVKYV